MSRRDIVVISFFVNAALLAFLFSTATKTSSETKPTPVSEVSIIETVKPPVVENILDQYVTVPLNPSQEPVESTQPVEKPSKDVVLVTVKKGDVLEKIARNNGTTVMQIMQINHLSSGQQLQIGQVLKVPVGEKKPEQPVVQLDEAKYYIVKEGDNPWTIATKNHLKFEEFLKLNGLDEQKAKRLRPGDRLRIR